MLPDPVCELLFRKLVVRQGEDCGDDIGFGRLELLSVQARKNEPRQKCDPLVAIAIRVTRRYAESICRCQIRQIEIIGVLPSTSSSSVADNLPSIVVAQLTHRYLSSIR